MLRILLVLLTLLNTNSFAEESYNNKNVSPEPVNYQWVQMYSNGVYSARAIVSNNICPVVQIATKSGKVFNEQMLPRIKLKKVLIDQDKITACEFRVDSKNYNSENVSLITINDKKIVIPSNIKKVALIGDTGCAVKQKDAMGNPQQCDDNNWKFPTIMNQITQEKIDIVVHLGDYYYRDYDES